MANPTLSIDPDPPKRGQDAKIILSDATTYPATLTLEWIPSGSGPATGMTDSSGVLVIAIPAGARGLSISGGGAPALSTDIDD